MYVKRRDLIRAHGLQPRDLRRVDPSLSPTKQSPNVTIKDECLLINIGGVRCELGSGWGWGKACTQRSGAWKGWQWPPGASDGAKPS